MATSIVAAVKLLGKMRERTRRGEKRRKSDGRCRKLAKKISVPFRPQTGFDLDIGAEDFGLSPSARDGRKGVRRLEAENSAMGNEDASGCL